MRSPLARPDAEPCTPRTPIMFRPCPPVAPLTYSPSQARVLLALFLLATAFFMAVTLSPLKRGFADVEDRGPGDIRLYRAEVDRIRAGEGYYDAAAEELVARGYPTRSVFNWRLPVPVALVGHLPDERMANLLLAVLGLCLLLISFHILAEECGSKPAILGVVLLSGALLPALLGDLMLMSELWSGVLLALSAACYGIERRKTGVVVGLAALFVRELAAPYCLVCVALALGGRRFKEVGLWAGGFALFLGYFAWHAGQVLPRIGPEAIAHGDGWIRFGGAGFLISTVQMNAYLLLVPQWVTAIYLGLALLGCATWTSPAGRRIALTVVAYCVAFSIVGHDFNQYWGCMIAPLLCLPVARSSWVLRQLWQRAELMSEASPAV